MRILLSAVIQLLFFGALYALMLACGPNQPPGITTLYVIGELGTSSVLCSLIFKPLRRDALPNWLMIAVAGFVLSHLAILAGLGMTATGHVPPVPGSASAGQSSFDYMALTLEVELVVVLAATAAMLMRARLGKIAKVYLSKFITTA